MASRGIVSSLAAIPALVLYAADLRSQETAPTEEAPASAPLTDLGDLQQLSLEELLNTRVITASKTEQSLEETPALVTVFSKDEIRKLGAKRLVDLLRLTPGFYEVSTPLGRNVAIRGVHAYAAQHFVVLIDGLPTADSLTSNSGPDEYDLSYAERVEIVRGPGSALYGANALTGVVNIVTRTGTGEDTHVAVLGGSDAFARAEMRHVLELGGDRSLLIAMSGWQHRGTRQDTPASADILSVRSGQNLADGIQDGENLTRPRPTVATRIDRYEPSYDLFLKLVSGKEWVARLNLAETTYVPPRALNQSLVRRADQTVQQQASNRRFLLDLERFFGDRAGIGELRVRPSLTYYRHAVDSSLIPSDAFAEAAYQQLPVATAFSAEDTRFVLNLEYAKTVDRIGAHVRDFALIAGVQGERATVTRSRLSMCYVDANEDVLLPSPYSGTTADETDLYCTVGALLNEGTIVDDFGNVRDTDSSHAGDGDDMSIGGYLQLSAVFLDRVNLTIGARADYNPDFDLQLSPRLAVAVKMPAGLYAKAQASRAFVLPAFLYRMGNSLSPFEGNPDIRAQSAQTAEVALGYRQAVSRIEVAGFHTRVSDFITYNPSNLVYRNRYRFSNQGDLDISGIEASGVTHLLDGNLSLIVGFTRLFPNETTDKVFLVDGHLGGPSKFPDYLASFVVNLVPWVDGLNLNVRAVLSSKVVMRETSGGFTFDQVIGSDGRAYSSKRTEDYDTSSLVFGGRLAYDLGALGGYAEGLVFFIEAENLLDRTSYRPGSTIVPYPRQGRTIVAGIGLH